MPLTPPEDVLPIFEDDQDVVRRRQEFANAVSARSTANSLSGSSLFDFWRLKLCGHPVLSEFTRSMERLVFDFNPTHRANRHIVGGVAEHLLAATLSVAGPRISVHGDDTDGFDISGTSKAGLQETISVKSSFGRSDYRISNGLGGAGRGMTHPTLFIGPTLPGLVIVHPDLHPKVLEALRDSGDSWTLSRLAVKRHADGNPECVIPLQAPENPGNLNGTDLSLKISREIVGSLGDCPHLAKYLLNNLNG